jgi:hypothetical protein
VKISEIPKNHIFLQRFLGTDFGTALREFEKSLVQKIEKFTLAEWHQNN